MICFDSKNIVCVPSLVRNLLRETHGLCTGTLRTSTLLFGLRYKNFYMPNVQDKMYGFKDISSIMQHDLNHVTA